MHKQLAQSLLSLFLCVSYMHWERFSSSANTLRYKHRYTCVEARDIARFNRQMGVGERGIDNTFNSKKLMHEINWGTRQMYRLSTMHVRNTRRGNIKDSYKNITRIAIKIYYEFFYIMSQMFALHVSNSNVIEIVILFIWNIYNIHKNSFVNMLI